MTGHDLLSSYSVKAVEYLIAATYLLLFVPFWRFVNHEVVPAPATETGWLGEMAGWFRVPEALHFHPGHAWARLGLGDLVTVGIDDFAHKLVGVPSALVLPAVGSTVRQGEKAWTLASEGRAVDMLSPVDGTVVAVNERAATAPGTLGQDPYGEGWLVKIRAPRLAANVKQLLSGAFARRWMEESCEGLRLVMSPELGRVLQDGGAPVDGMARTLAPEHWDELARRFLLS